MTQTNWRKRLIQYCESLEEEASKLEEAENASEFQLGFAFGQRTTAKKIRREIGEVFREWQETNPTYIYGH